MIYHYQKKDLGPLHDLLLRSCPPAVLDHETGKYRLASTPDELEAAVKSVIALADLLGLTKESAYMWIRRNKVPGGRIRDIVALSGGEVSYTDFEPYM